MAPVSPDTSIRQMRHKIIDIMDGWSARQFQSAGWTPIYNCERCTTTAPKRERQWRSRFNKRSMSREIDRFLPDVEDKHGHEGATI